MSLDRAKLAAILGRLGSDFDGERANAASLATKMLKAAGMTWQQLAEGGGGGESRNALLGAYQAGAAAAETWRTKWQAAERKNEELRRSARAHGRRAADLEARLEIAAAENAKLREALGPERAAQAVLGGNQAVAAMREAGA